MGIGLYLPGGGSDQGDHGGGTLFANGYTKQFELVAPAAITGAVTAYEWLDSTQSAELKTVANSGYVESAAGKDIRYELLDGTKVPHKILTYNGATGLLVAVVLYQTVSGSTDNRLFRYVGNPVVAAGASEENAAGTFANCAEVWQPGNTTALTGSGRTLSTQGAVASETVDTFNFGSVLKLSGTGGYLYLTDGSSWLNAIDALSFVVIAKAATGYANTQGLLSIGGALVTGATDLSVSLLLRYEATGHPLSAPPPNVLAYADTRTDPTNLATARDGRARLESVANFQDAAWHTYLVNRAADSAEHLGIDGALPSELFDSDAGLQGPLALGSPAKIRIGTGPHAQSETLGDWNGLIAYVRLGATQVGAAWWAAFDLNYRDPLAFYGSSVARGVSGNRGPVATPKHATVAAGGSVTVNVLAGATSPDGLTLTVTACSLPGISGATRTLATPNVTYHAPAAAVGSTDEVTFTVADTNGLQSLAKLRVAITNGSPVVAVADTATCAYQSSVTVDVLANDTGGLAALSTSAFDAASAHSGTIARAAAPNANKLVYTAPSGFSGADTFGYTATDGTTSASAAVTVTVSAAAGLTAVNDQFVVFPSATTACDVLLNDTGATGILDIPAAPSFGSATVAAGKVSYVAGAAAGPDQIVYRARNAAGVTAPAVCSLDVQSATLGTGEWSDPNFTKSDGTPKTPRSPTANTPAALTTLFNKFCGVGSPVYDSSTDYIQITGVIAGASIWTAIKPAGATKNPGTQAHPLIIMAGMPADKDVSTNGFGEVLNNVRAQWIWFHQCTFTRAATSDVECINFDSTADNLFITRCYFNAPKGIFTAPPAGQHYSIGYCKFGSHNTSTLADTAHQIQINTSGSGVRPDFGHIYRCWSTADTDSTTPGGDQQPSFVYSGEGTANPDGGHGMIPYETNILNTVIEHNYCQYGRKNVIYLKAGAVVRRNHLIKASPTGSTGNANSPNVGHNIGLRGNNCTHAIVAFNRMTGGSELAVEGWYHDIIGNIMTGSQEHIELCAKANSTNPKPLMGAEYCCCAGNVVANPIVVGFLRSGGSYSEAPTEHLGYKGAPYVRLIGNTKTTAGAPEAAYQDHDGNTIGFSAATDGLPTGSHNYIVDVGVRRTATEPATVVGNNGTYDLSEVPPDYSTNTARQVGPSATDGNATWLGGPGSLIPGAPAVGTVVSLPLDSTYLTNWAVLKGSTAIVGQTSDYLEITGGADISNDYGGAFTKAQFTLPFRVDYEYYHDPSDTNAFATGTFSQIYLLRGTNTSHSVADFAGSTNPSDTPLSAAGARGARASFDTKNAANPALADKVRWRAITASGPSGSNFNTMTRVGDVVPDFVFTPAVWHRCSVLVQADTTIFTALIADATGAFTTFRTQWFGTVPGGVVDTDAQAWLKNLSTQTGMGSSGAVNIGLTASEGRKCRYRRVFVTAT